MAYGTDPLCHVCNMTIDRCYCIAATPALSGDVEQRARELLAAEYWRDGHKAVSLEIKRGNLNRVGGVVPAIRAIIAALSSGAQPRGGGEVDEDIFPNAAALHIALDFADTPSTLSIAYRAAEIALTQSGDARLGEETARAADLLRVAADDVAAQYCGTVADTMRTVVAALSSTAAPSPVVEKALYMRSNWQPHERCIYIYQFEIDGVNSFRIATINLANVSGIDDETERAACEALADAICTLNMPAAPVENKGGIAPGHGNTPAEAWFIVESQLQYVEEAISGQYGGRLRGLRTAIEHARWASGQAQGAVDEETLRIAIWNACRSRGMGDEPSYAIINDVCSTLFPPPLKLIEGAR